MANQTLEVQIGINDRRVLTPVRAKEFLVNFETYLDAQRAAGWKHISIHPLAEAVMDVMKDVAADLDS